MFLHGFMEFSVASMGTHCVNPCTKCVSICRCVQNASEFNACVCSVCICAVCVCVYVCMCVCVWMHPINPKSGLPNPKNRGETLLDKKP
jgi:hypothetical protein